MGAGMAKHREPTWQELPLDIIMVEPNFLGTGTGAIIARFAKLKDAQAMQRCFWRKSLELRDASMQAIENLKPARRSIGKRKRAKQRQASI